MTNTRNTNGDLSAAAQKEVEEMDNAPAFSPTEKLFAGAALVVIILIASHLILGWPR